MYPCLALVAKRYKLLALGLWGCVALVACTSPQDREELQVAKSRYAQLLESYHPSDEIVSALDSLESVAIRYDDDSLRSSLLCTRAGYYSDVSQPYKMDSCLQRAEPLLPQDAIELRIKYHRLKSLYLDSRNEYAAAIWEIEKAIQLAEQYPSELKPGMLVRLHSHLATMYIHIGDNEQAKASVAKTWEIYYRQPEDLELEAMLYRLEGRICMQANDLNRAIAIHDKALRRLKDESEQMPNKNILRTQRVEVLLQIEYAKKEKRPEDFERLRGEIIQVIELEHKNLQRPNMLAILYSDLATLSLEYRSVEEAEAYLRLAEGYSGEMASREMLKRVALDLALRAQKPEAIRQSIQELESYRNSVGSATLNDETESYRLLSKAYEALGEHRQALALRDSLMYYEDSLGRIEQARIATGIQIEHQLRDLRLELEEEQRLSGKYLLLLALLALVASLASLLLYRYQRRAIGLEPQPSSQSSTEANPQALHQTEPREDKREQGDTSLKKSMPAQETEENILARLIELMDTQSIYRSPQLSLDGLAEQLYTNRSYLSKLINIRMGMNYTEYINSYRIAEAKQILRATPDEKLQNVSRQVGFGSQSSFIAAFKKSEGCTPSEWVRQRG